MKTDLKRDISRDLLARVEYACAFWVFHFKQVDHRGYDLQDNWPVHQFLKQHLLHCLEAVSRMEKFSDGILAIMDLECTLPVSQFTFITDIEKLKHYHDDYFTDNFGGSSVAS